MVMVTEACENPAVTYTLLTSFLNQGFINQYGLHYEIIRDKIWTLKSVTKLMKKIDNQSPFQMNDHTNATE